MAEHFHAPAAGPNKLFEQIKPHATGEIGLPGCRHPALEGPAHGIGGGKAGIVEKPDVGGNAHPKIRDCKQEFSLARKMLATTEDADVASAMLERIGEDFPHLTGDFINQGWADADPAAT